MQPWHCASAARAGSKAEAIVPSLGGARWDLGSAGVRFAHSGRVGEHRPSPASASGRRRRPRSVSPQLRASSNPATAPVSRSVATTPGERQQGALASHRGSRRQQARRRVPQRRESRAAVAPVRPPDRRRRLTCPPLATSRADSASRAAPCFRVRASISSAGPRWLPLSESSSGYEPLRGPDRGRSAWGAAALSESCALLPAHGCAFAGPSISSR